MKLNKSQAIARRNLELGGAVLGVNNCHFTDLTASAISGGSTCQWRALPSANTSGFTC